MEKIKGLPEYNYDEKSDLELIVGDFAQRAEISLPGEAWIRGFEKGRRIYNKQVAQQGTYRHHPKRNMVYAIGTVKEGEHEYLAYMEDSDPQSNKSVYTLRLVDWKDVVSYQPLKLENLSE